MRHYPTIGQSIWLLLHIFPISIPVIIPFYIFHFADNGTLLPITYVLCFSGLVWIGLKKRKNFTLPRISFSLLTLLISLAFLISFHFVIDPLSEVIPEPEGLIKSLEEMMRYPILTFITIAFFAPILEEILFRGIILDGYLKNYSPALSILLSALLFALIHGNIAQGLGALLMGITTGLLYWRTQSLLLCIALHFANNFLAGLIIFLDPESLQSIETTQAYINNDKVYWLLYVLACILFIACGWYLWKKYLAPATHLIYLKPTPVSAESLVQKTMVEPKS